MLTIMQLVIANEDNLYKTEPKIILILINPCWVVET